MTYNTEIRTWAHPQQIRMLADLRYYFLRKMRMLKKGRGKTEVPLNIQIAKKNQKIMKFTKKYIFLCACYLGTCFLYFFIGNDLCILKQNAYLINKKSQYLMKHL